LPFHWESDGIESSKGVKFLFEGQAIDWAFGGHDTKARTGVRRARGKWRGRTKEDRSEDWAIVCGIVMAIAVAIQSAEEIDASTVTPYCQDGRISRDPEESWRSFDFLGNEIPTVPDHCSVRWVQTPKTTSGEREGRGGRGILWGVVSVLTEIGGEVERVRGAAERGGGRDSKSHVRVTDDSTLDMEIGSEECVPQDSLLLLLLSLHRGRRRSRGRGEGETGDISAMGSHIASLRGKRGGGGDEERRGVNATRELARPGSRQGERGERRASTGRRRICESAHTSSPPLTREGGAHRDSSLRRSQGKGRGIGGDQGHCCTLVASLLGPLLTLSSTLFSLFSRGLFSLS
jgi:hypothetical protein